MKSFVVVAMAVLAAGCSSDADIASYNVSKAADQFEVPRRITTGSPGSTC